MIASAKEKLTFADRRNIINELGGKGAWKELKKTMPLEEALIKCAEAATRTGNERIKLAILKKIEESAYHIMCKGQYNLAEKILAIDGFSTKDLMHVVKMVLAFHMEKDNNYTAAVEVAIRYGVQEKSIYENLFVFAKTVNKIPEFMNTIIQLGSNAVPLVKAMEDNLEFWFELTKALYTCAFIYNEFAMAESAAKAFGFDYEAWNIRVYGERSKKIL